MDQQDSLVEKSACHASWTIWIQSLQPTTEGENQFPEVVL